MEGAVTLSDGRTIAALQARLAEHSLAFNRATIGQDLTYGRRKGRLPGQMIGKSPWLQSGIRRDWGRRSAPCSTSPTYHSAPQQSWRCFAQRQVAADGQTQPSPAPTSDRGRARLELEFDQPYLLGPLFGDYDRHLVMIEERLGVPHQCPRQPGNDRGRARQRGRAPATYWSASTTGSTRATTSMPPRSEAVIGMANQPALDGIIHPPWRGVVGDDPPPARRPSSPARPSRRSTWKRWRAMT